MTPASCDTPAERVAGKKQVRKTQVMEALRSKGPLSRVDVARGLGFNVSTVAALVDELVAEGIAVELRDKKPSIGRPPIPVALNPSAACVLGIDLGRTTSECMLMDISGHVLGRIERPSPTGRDPRKDTAYVESLIVELLRTHKDNLPPLAGVGVAVPGILYNKEEGAPKELEEPKELEDHITNLLHVPVIVEGDSRMLALGELWFGHQRDLRTFAVVIITDGLGSTLMIDRKPYYGIDRIAGDLGHVPLGDPGVECFCGGHSCLENIASGKGLERMAEVAGLMVDGRPAHPGELAAMARKGDQKACEIFDRFAAGLARGVSTVIMMGNPEMVILSGRVARYSDVFIERFEKELREKVLPVYMRHAKVTVSDLYEDAVSLGTCACVLHHIFGVSHITVESVV